MLKRKDCQEEVAKHKNPMQIIYSLSEEFYDLNMKEVIMDRDLFEEAGYSCGDLKGSDQEECIRFYEERAGQEEETPIPDEEGK